MGAWGEGSLREKRPGVFEIRVAVGVDPVSGRTVKRSFWFHVHSRTPRSVAGSWPPSSPSTGLSVGVAAIRRGDQEALE